jgi:adenylate cyclase
MTETSASASGISAEKIRPVERRNRLAEGFRIDNWTVEPALNQLTRNGDVMRLEPKVMELLVYLAERPGQAISRDELEREVWAGTVVSYDALTGAIQKLRKAFNDDSHHPRFIETLSKRGYRLLAPVEPLDRQEKTHEQPSSGAAGILTRFRGQIVRLLVFLALLATAGAVIWYTARDHSGQDAPSDIAVNSIAVLPFGNLNADPEQDYFSDGMTDDLITDLSNISGLTVISRNSVFAYKGRAIKPQELAQELGATHILEGSIRRAGNRIRINAQFIDARSGTHLWAERYDRNLDNIFQVQDEITERIVTALKIELSDQEKSELEKHYTKNIAAYDMFLKGQQQFLKFTREGNSGARGYFKKATELDPGFARAFANYGWTYARDFQDGWTSTPEKSLDFALELALKAKSLDATSSRVHWILGQVYLYKREYELAMENVKKAIELSPSSPDPKILLARILTFSGDPSRSIEVIKEAMGVNPFYPMQYEMNLGMAYFANGDYEKASQALMRAMERNPDAQRVRMWLVATYANAGDLDAAMWEYEELMMINPEFSVESLEHSIPFRDEAIRDRLFYGLRLASSR